MRRNFTNRIVRNQIFSDWNSMINSYESQTLKLMYEHVSDESSLDKVYKTPIGGTRSKETFEFKGFIVSFKISKSSAESFEFLESGDTLIYTYGELNLNEPIPGKKPVTNTLFIVDPSGNRWTPNIRKSEELQRNFEVLLGDSTISTVIVVNKLEGMHSEA